MKVQLAVVKAEFRETRALEPHMYNKPFPVDARLADLLEMRSRGRIRRIEAEDSHTNIPTPKRRGRPPKNGNAAPAEAERE